MSKRLIFPDSPSDTRVVIYENNNEIECFDPVYTVAETDREWFIEGVQHEYRVSRNSDRRLAFQVRDWVEVDYVPGVVMVSDPSGWVVMVSDPSGWVVED